MRQKGSSDKKRKRQKGREKRTSVSSEARDNKNLMHGGKQMYLSRTALF
jgi:hypothetical protein